MTLILDLAGPAHQILPDLLPENLKRFLRSGEPCRSELLPFGVLDTCSELPSGDLGIIIEFLPILWFDWQVMASEDGVPNYLLTMTRVGQPLQQHMPAWLPQDPALARTAGGIDATMSSPSPSYDSQWDPFDSSSQQQIQVDKLALCQLADWNSESTYDEDPPNYIHYSIEWKVTANNRVLSRDTEQDVVLAPASYWQLFLEPKLKKLLDNKFGKKRPVKPEHSTVVVSVKKDSERDLTKTFDGTDIDWAVIENQLTFSPPTGDAWCYETNFTKSHFSALLHQFAVPYVMSHDLPALAPQHTYITSETGRFWSLSPSVCLSYDLMPDILPLLHRRYHKLFEFRRPDSEVQYQMRTVLGI